MSTADRSSALPLPAAFFDRVRSRFGPLREPQVAALEPLAIRLSEAWTDLRWTAYALATTWHETATTCEPIREYGDDERFESMYGPQTSRGQRLGNTDPGDGARYCGRGYVQVTGRANYARMGQVIGVDLVGNPDLALDPRHALTILVLGMQRGLFTRRKLADFVDGEHCDYVEARRIINGLDRADLIAAHARTFEAALKAGRGLAAKES